MAATELVVAILKFLDEQQSSPAMDEETRESLEVATQCLETAYGVSREDPLSVPASLSQIYEEGVKHIQAAPQASTAQKESGDSLKAAGNNKMKEEKYSEALDCYTKAIQEDGNNAVYFCNRAAAYSKLNNHQKALADCMKALEIDPKYSKAFGRKGLAHTAMSQHHAARDCYKKALELDPVNESYKNNLLLAEQKIQEEGGSSRQGDTPVGGPGGPVGPGGLNLGGMDFSALLNNPALMNMASSMLSNPQMQNMMASMMSGQGESPEAGPPQGIEGLLQAGQQLAQQMQQSNPELIDELRTRYRGSDDSNEQPPGPPEGDS